MPCLTTPTVLPSSYPKVNPMYLKLVFVKTKSDILFEEYCFSFSMINSELKMEWDLYDLRSVYCQWLYNRCTNHSTVMTLYGHFYKYGTSFSTTDTVTCTITVLSLVQFDTVICAWLLCAEISVISPSSTSVWWTVATWGLKQRHKRQSKPGPLAYESHVLTTWLPRKGCRLQ